MGRSEWEIFNFKMINSRFQTVESSKDGCCFQISTLKGAVSATGHSISSAPTAYQPNGFAYWILFLMGDADMSYFLLETCALVEPIICWHANCPCHCAVLTRQGHIKKTT